jgi:hypothetical protein
MKIKGMYIIAALLGTMWREWNKEPMMREIYKEYCRLTSMWLPLFQVAYDEDVLFRLHLLKALQKTCFFCEKKNYVRVGTCGLYCCTQHAEKGL